jgi:hypothetical protein
MKICLRSFLGFILVFGLLAVDLGPGQPSSAVAQPTRPSAAVGFGEVVSDDAIVQFCLRNDVRLTAVYIWNSGFAGTHRTYAALDAAALLREARATIIESAGNGLKSSVFRLQQFAQEHSEAEVAARDDLQTEARSLLNIRAKLAAKQRAAMRGEPLVYAVEVSADSSDKLEMASRDPMAKGFQFGAGDGRGVAQSLKPAAYQLYYEDPGVAAMNAGELYRQIAALGGGR